jgi:hypothetical protein
MGEMERSVNEIDIVSIDGIGGSQTVLATAAAGVIFAA